MDILERLKKARQSKITAGSFEFTIKRPTDMDAVTMQYTSDKEATLGVMGFVLGWDGVKNYHVIKGGTEEPEPFSAELFQDWIQDQPGIWPALVDGVLGAYTAHREAQDSEGKP